MQHTGQVGAVLRGTKGRPCPQNISAYRCKKERSVAFKIRQNAFPVGAAPGPCWGVHDARSGLLVGWRGDTPRHTHRTPRFSGLWRSPVTLNSIQLKVCHRLTLWLVCKGGRCRHWSPVVELSRQKLFITSRWTCLVVLQRSVKYNKHLQWRLSTQRRSQQFRHRIASQSRCN